jgi:DNA-binding NtrC family response regulator
VKHDTDPVDRLCEQLAAWRASRKYFARQSVPPSLLGRLQKRASPYRGEPDARCSAELAALHVALLSQPEDSVARKVFELHYFHRVGNVKAAAAALGIGRAHWYRLLEQFREQLHQASLRILQANEAELAALASRRAQAASLLGDALQTSSGERARE